MSVGCSAPYRRGIAQLVNDGWTIGQVVQPHIDGALHNGRTNQANSSITVVQPHIDGALHNGITVGCEKQKVVQPHIDGALHNAAGNTPEVKLLFSPM